MIVTNLPPPPFTVPMYVGNQMNIAWVKWLQLLWSRVGGTTGEEIYQQGDIAQLLFETPATPYVEREGIELINQLLTKIEEQIQWESNSAIAVAVGILRAETDSRLAALEARLQVYIQSSAPVDSNKFLWIQDLGSGNFTLWVNT